MYGSYVAFKWVNMPVIVPSSWLISNIQKVTLLNVIPLKATKIRIESKIKVGIGR